MDAHFVLFLSKLVALYQELPGGGGGRIVTRQTIRFAPEYERAMCAAGPGAVPGPATVSTPG